MKRTPYGVVVLAGLLMGGCPDFPFPSEPLNPFRDLPPIPMDGRPYDVANTIVPLGELKPGDVIRVEVNGETVNDVLVLVEDAEFEEAGVLAGGGPPNEPFDYRVNIASRYYLFVYFDPSVVASQRLATVAVGPGPADYAPPSRQYVQLFFAPSFLSEPGLFDPVSGTPDEQQFLVDISPQVQAQIVDYLRGLFADTPVVVLAPDDPPPPGPVSRLTFMPDRVLAAEQDIVDAALPPPDPTRPECQERVVFGEILPRGDMQDTGNRTPDDQAVVYVGSFQGRGETCRTAAINSVNNIVLTLSQTGAHEIGHLVGLWHVEQTDIMNRSATLAFQRELSLMRGQVQIELLYRGEVINEVLTTVVQDPAVYFRAVFP
jgi:hypothetical protein